jgi:hypothetical protein
MDFYDKTLASGEEIMAFSNIHIDHIKPVSVFNMDDAKDFASCCHYTDLQPLLSTQNAEKSNKWSKVDEVFWSSNIRNKAEYLEIYLPSSKTMAKKSDS